MDNLLSSIYHHVDSFDLIETRPAAPKHVRLAILDSGFDPANPLLLTDDQQLDPRIKDVRSFVSQTEPLNIQDKIGHGTHALGLLLSVATSAEIYIAKIASRETMDRDSYDAIAKARLSKILKTLLRRANTFYRPSITQSLTGTWTSYRCHLEYGNTTSL